MPELTLNIDRQTYSALVDRAISERRPVDLQAEVILRTSLGLSFPYSAEVADERER